MTPWIVLATIVGYFCLLFFITFLANRKSKDAGFYADSVKAPWYIVSFATMGAAISGVTFVSVPGMVEAKGFSYLQMQFGFIFGYAIIAFMLVPMFYKRNLVSIYGYLAQRFGSSTHKSGAWFFFVSKMLGAAVRFYVVCVTLQALVFHPLGIPFEINVLFTVALLALSVSCTQDEMFIQENASPIEIIGRIPNFDPHYVNTRSVKTEAENRIYNMTLLVFNTDSVLEDIQTTEGSAAIFIVNKKTSAEMDNNLTIDGSEKMYLLANVEHLFDNTWTKDSEKTIEDLKTITSPNNSIGIMRTGFPMVGSIQLDSDMLNNQKIQIGLEMLYAKVELNIKVDATQISPNNPQFQLTSCFVHNLPQGISLVKNIKGLK